MLTWFIFFYWKSYSKVKNKIWFIILQYLAVLAKCKISLCDRLSPVRPPSVCCYQFTKLTSQEQTVGFWWNFICGILALISLKCVWFGSFRSLPRSIYEKNTFNDFFSRTDCAFGCNFICSILALASLKFIQIGSF